jgi:RHS repeat-associated protein
VISFLVTGTFSARWLHRLGTSFECITWNAMNELIAVTKNAVTQATFSYDAMGRRVEKVAAGTATGWVYDTEDILLQRATASGVTTPTWFVHGPGVDEPMGIENPTSGAMTYLHGDALNSIARHTDAGGSVSHSIDYDAWGNMQAGTQMSYAFTGREWDASAEMYYYRSRWYDPKQGRFISEDPIGFRGGLNLALYVEASPTNFADPSGLFMSYGWWRNQWNIYQRGTGRDDGGYSNRVNHCRVHCESYRENYFPIMTPLLSHMADYVVPKAEFPGVQYEDDPGDRKANACGRNAPPAVSCDTWCRFSPQMQPLLIPPPPLPPLLPSPSPAPPPTPTPNG